MMTSSSDTSASEAEGRKGLLARLVGLPGCALGIVRSNRMLALLCVVGFLLGAYGGWWGWG